MGHQAGNEMNAPAEATELGNRDGAFTVTKGLGKRGGELRAALDRIRAFAGFDLDEFADDLVTLGGGEPGDRGALGADAETGAALLASAHPEVGDQARQTISWRIARRSLPNYPGRAALSAKGNDRDGSQIKA
jgi:hypothetical protein